MRRPSVLVTANSSSFLNDPAGDRRFWVVEIPESHIIDRIWVAQNADQIWAQAKTMYKQGEQWWLTDAETLLSNQQNKKFRRPDALTEAVNEYLLTDPTVANLSSTPRYEDGVGFTMKQLVSIGLDKKLADIQILRVSGDRIYLVLRVRKTQVRVGKGNGFIYFVN